MISIPPFPLPSNPSKTIQFRAPTVADCLDFTELREEMEESATTDYLRQLQGDKVDDPALWTAQDRRTALWWIYVSSSNDTTLSYSYDCQHCGEKHHADINLVDLDDALVVLNRPAFEPGTVFCNGHQHPATFHPFDGRAAMHLEEKRLELDGVTGSAARRIKAELKILEVVHSFSLDEHKSLPWDEQVAKKLEMVKAMDREHEYPPLVAKIMLTHSELRHGLAMEEVDGKLDLISPPLYCETKEAAKNGSVPATALLMRFRAIDFIPEI